MRDPPMDDVAAALDRLTLEPAQGQAGQAEAPLRVPSFGRLLLALDGSPGSAAALAWAAELTRRLPTELTVLCVAPRGDSPALGARRSAMAEAVAVAYEEAEEEAARVLRDAANALDGHDVPHTARLEHGSPAARIVAAAQQADLVILGSHGHGGGERLHLGSVGSAVKHHVPCSLLVARHPPPSRGVLLALDGSRQARAAAEAGLRLARRLQAPVHVGHVVPPALLGFARRGRRAAGLALAWQQDMAAAGLPQPLVATGPPAKRIAEMAEAAGADLVVVGSRGLGGLRSLALGSVSDRLTFSARPSVLVVKP